MSLQIQTREPTSIYKTWAFGEKGMREPERSTYWPLIPNLKKYSVHNEQEF